MVPKRFKVHKWQVFEEKVAPWAKPDLSITGFVDHLNTTKDETDYLLLITSIYVDEKELNGSQPVVSIQSKGDGFYFFVNNEYQGSGYGVPVVLEQPNPVVLEQPKSWRAIQMQT